MNNIKSMIEIVFNASDSIKNNRTLSDIFLHLSSEIGELSDEIMVKTGQIPIERGGGEGIIGESIDCIVCLLDIIHKTNPNITEEMLSEIMLMKCEKWKKNY